VEMAEGGGSSGVHGAATNAGEKRMFDGATGNEPIVSGQVLRKRGRDNSRWGADRGGDGRGCCEDPGVQGAASSVAEHQLDGPTRNGCRSVRSKMNGEGKRVRSVYADGGLIDSCVCVRARACVCVCVCLHRFAPPTSAPDAPPPPPPTPTPPPFPAPLSIMGLGLCLLDSTTYICICI